MKTNMVSRIIEASKEENQSLVELCKRWKPEERIDGKWIIDPVTCIRVHVRDTIIVFYNVILCVLAFSLLFHKRILTMPITPQISNYLYLISTCLLLSMIIISLVSIKKIEGWIHSNSTSFITALKIAEKRSGRSFENFDILFRGTNIIMGIKESLEFSASEIHRMRIIPWQSKKADKEFEKWKIEHGLLRRLFPELPEDYDAYFPKANDPARAL